MIYLGNVKDYVTSELKQEAESLFLKTNSHIRNKETHFQNCINGLCAEVALNKFFKLQKNVSEDLYYDSYDENNKKYEIKTTYKNENWWTLKRSPLSTNYDYFIQNSEKIDYIVLIFIDEKNEMYLKYRANAKTFKNYVQKSKFNDGLYYNNERASRNNDLQIF